MGFIQRAFTAPGTGGREAAAIIAQAEAADAAKAASARPVAAPPTLPSISAAPPPPQAFAMGQSPQAKQKQQRTASSMLGVAATGGETARGQLTGGTGQGKTMLG